jgi:DNA-binding NarL/FixJ family response regulator
MSVIGVNHSAPLRVAIAESGGLFREGLVLMLEAIGHHVVGATEDGDQLLALLAVESADIALLGIHMPPEPDGGLVAAAQVRLLYPKTGLLLLSAYSKADYLMRVLEIGTEAIGYRLTSRMSGLESLRDTLARIADGEIVLDPAVAGLLVGQPSSPDELGSLTSREIMVLRLMAEGRSNSGIAREAFLSAKAVEKHVASIFAKLGLPTDAASHHRRVLAVLTYLRVRRDEGL